jgi:hypothetical protein
MGTLFLTGMQRSGTTLLQRLLDGHPRLSVLSQPFPFLFVEAKRRFLAARGLGDSAYPLGHLFGETRYSARDLAAFLEVDHWDRDALLEVFTNWDGSPGQYTRFSRGDVERAIGDLPLSGLASVVARLYRTLAPARSSPDASPQAEEATFHGGKECLCEELVPHLLAHGHRVLLILRDPRDVIASLNLGQGALHGGAPKPTLFNLRNWRKSVAFALALEERPGFAWVRYEDLVAEPIQVLDRIAGLLGVAPFPLASLDLRSTDGERWTGNSSHGALRGVDPGRAGGARHLLAPEVLELVEAACLPELAALGYPVSLRLEAAPGILRAFRDPYGSARPELAALAEDPAERELEVARLERLAGGVSGDAAAWFLFPGLAERLARVCR